MFAPANTRGNDMHLYGIYLKFHIITVSSQHGTNCQGFPVLSNIMARWL